MIDIAMGDHKGIQMIDTECSQGRDHGASPQVQATGDRSRGIHQHGRARPLQEQRIALPHIEHDEPRRTGYPIRRRRCAEPQHRRERDHQHRGSSAHSASLDCEHCGHPQRDAMGTTAHPASRSEYLGQPVHRSQGQGRDAMADRETSLRHRALETTGGGGEERGRKKKSARPRNRKHVDEHTGRARGESAPGQ